MRERELCRESLIKGETLCNMLPTNELNGEGEAVRERELCRESLGRAEGVMVWEVIKRIFGALPIPPGSNTYKRPKLSVVRSSR